MLYLSRFSCVHISLIGRKSRVPSNLALAMSSARLVWMCAVIAMMSLAALCPYALADPRFGPQNGQPVPLDAGGHGLLDQLNGGLSGAPARICTGYPTGCKAIFDKSSCEAQVTTVHNAVSHLVAAASTLTILCVYHATSVILTISDLFRCILAAVPASRSAILAFC